MSDGLPSYCDARLTFKGAEFTLWPYGRQWNIVIVERPIKVRNGAYGRHSYWLDGEPVDRTDVPTHVTAFITLVFRQEGIQELIIEPRSVKLVGEFNDRTWKRIKVPLRGGVDRLYEAAPQLVATV